MVTFEHLPSVKRGRLFEMLASSYRDLTDRYDPKNKDKYLQDWKKADDNAFDNPDTIGKCVLVTHLDGKPVGFVSWDPRHFPEYGIIGQNCVLPRFRGKGYGKMQIGELLRIFREAKCKKALVSTGDSDFFLPAQKMYQSLGFKETSRHLEEKWGYSVIEYEKRLDTYTRRV